MSSQRAGNYRLSRFLKLRKTRIVLAIIGILIIIRILLPYVLLHYANKALSDMPGYYGHIQDLDLSLYRGAYQLNTIYLNKQDSVTGKQTDFFRAANVDLSVEWKALLHGSLVGEIELDRPVLIFTKNKTELSQVKKDTNDFRKIIKQFMPLTINRLELQNGSIQYADQSATPAVDVSLQQVYLLAKNLNNSYDSTKQLPASITAPAKAYEGTFHLDMRLDPLAKDVTFDLNAELKNTNLVLLNDMLSAYGHFDVNRGNLGLYTELAAKEGKFKGYVKPVIRDLDVVGREDKKDPFFHKIWESIVGGAGVIFRNQKKDQVATKVPLEGTFEDPTTNAWDAVWEVLRNAFIQALLPSVDNQINIASVDQQKKEDKKNIFQKIFSGKKEKKRDRKK